MEFAKSLSGHDKDEVYMVLRTDKESLYLVNGKNRLMAEPKRKNKKHVQIIKKLPAEITDCFSAGVTDLSIKRAIKLYDKRYDQMED